MSDVTARLRDLQAGDVTIEEIVAEFSARSWPTATPPPPKDAAELGKREQADRDPDPDGSFAEVAQAFYNGIITVDEYSAIVEAVGTSKAPAETPEAEETPPADAEEDES